MTSTSPERTLEETGVATAVGGIGSALGVGTDYEHTHRDEDEVLYVLEGEVEFLLGEDTIPAAGAGSCVYAPKGTLHVHEGLLTSSITMEANYL